MRVVRAIAEMMALGGGDLGLVPTMGAFHEGHLTLMREARRHHTGVCVSLFVNPLQFGPGEDFEKYPRDEERDHRLAEEAGVDILFAPKRSEVYPRQSTTIHVAELTDAWEGSVRPGHFDGVATVVCKLFHITRPRAAYFGWKDLQQCLVIRRMVEDLNMPVDLRFLDTVREADGLAMSSRNAYLSSEERARAPVIRETLLRAEAEMRRGNGSIDDILSGARGELELLGLTVDYLELVSMENMQPVRCRTNATLIVAVRLGATRLIDNLRIDA